jgi:hypothetical protein
MKGTQPFPECTTGVGGLTRMSMCMSARARRTACAIIRGGMRVYALVETPTSMSAENALSPLMVNLGVGITLVVGVPVRALFSQTLRRSPGEAVMVIARQRHARAATTRSRKAMVAWY